MFRRKAKAPRPLRYLVYLSETKIDMLLDQIPDRVRRELAIELKVDLKLLSWKMARESAELPGKTRISKMALVERHLEENHMVGGPTATRGYFRAQADMDWILLEDGVVLFAGQIGSNLVFLGGSASNLIGGGHLAQGLGSHASVIQRKLTSLMVGADHKHNGDIGAHVSTVFQDVYSSPQRVEFLARHLAHGRVDQPSVYQTYIVGSPLFVELISEPTPAEPSQSCGEV